jgi:hypothetical protein
MAPNDADPVERVRAVRPGADPCRPLFNTIQSIGSFRSELNATGKNCDWEVLITRRTEMKHHRLGTILAVAATTAIAGLTLGMSTAGADGIVGVIGTGAGNSTGANTPSPASNAQSNTNANGNVCFGVFAPLPCGSSAPSGSTPNVPATPPPAVGIDGSVAGDGTANADGTDVAGEAAAKADANLDVDAAKADAAAKVCSNGTVGESAPTSGGSLPTVGGLAGALLAGALGIQHHRKKASVVS